MSKVKIGILGAGFIAKVHIGNLKNDERTEIAAVADLYLDKAKALAKEAGPETNAFSSLDELLANEVDAVYVTTPNTLHVEPVLKCLQNNVNVFCEKPMATSLGDAERIKEARASSKGIYNLGMNMRYGYVFKRVKHLIDAGEVTPYMVNVKLNRGELLNPPWTADPKVTGGFLYETPIHLFDICRYLFGEVTTVKCEARQSISQSEFDDFAVLLTFESGTIGTFVTSAHAGWSYPFQRLEIYGKYSTTTVEDMEKVIYAPGLKRGTEENDFKQVPFEEKWGYVEEDRLFVDAIVNGSKPPVSAEDGYLLSKLLDGIYESAKTGKQLDFRQ
jgi:myo-inositol 2-dehydrogenase / D-chiro-inositol 1-dehydrogenase